MRRVFAIGAAWIVLGAVCGAQKRWCTVTGLGEGQRLIYPPIARAARLSGVVLSHITYLPDGTVQTVEPIFGPAMLSEGLTRQAQDWTVKTNAAGDESCISLVIAKFSVSGECNVGPPIGIAAPADVTQPSTLMLAVEATPFCITDSAPDIQKGFKARVRRVRQLLARVL